MVLSAPITVGKSTINYIVLQGKEGDKAIADIDG
jgi:hypothetical protein